ncbi:MAG: hypothetical protein IPK19_08325 [Chloroflexi bacterium]|nr:hypothetical protein [Chloroflexota bacterium]
MASANVEGMMREGVNAMKAGRRDEARALLLRAVELDQYNEEAWLWLSGVLDSQEDQRTALENVLSINPGNDRARQGLDYINQQLGISSSSPPPMPSSLPPETGGLSTSVEWGAPSSTPEPVGRFPAPSPEPTPDVLDDWVNNLGLQSSAGAAIEDLRQTLGNNSPFGDVEVDMEDDIFSAGPFRADEPPAAKPTGKQTTKPVAEPVEPALTPEQRAERSAPARQA